MARIATPRGIRVAADRQRAPRRLLSQPRGADRGHHRISAGVPDPDGRPFLAVSLSAISARIPQARVRPLAADLVRSCTRMASSWRQGAPSARKESCTIAQPWMRETSRQEQESQSGHWERTGPWGAVKAEVLFSVRGTAVIVTGAGSGIGYACAKVLAANGARVTLLDRNAIRASRGDTTAHRCGRRCARRCRRRNRSRRRSTAPSMPRRRPMAASTPCSPMPASAAGPAF